MSLPAAPEATGSTLAAKHIEILITGYRVPAAVSDREDRVGGRRGVEPVGKEQVLYGAVLRQGVVEGRDDCVGDTIRGLRRTTIAHRVQVAVDHIEVPAFATAHLVRAGPTIDELRGIGDQTVEALALASVRRVLADPSNDGTGRAVSGADDVRSGIAVEPVQARIAPGDPIVALPAMGLAAALAGFDYIRADAAKDDVAGVVCRAVKTLRIGRDPRGQEVEQDLVGACGFAESRHLVPHSNARADAPRGPRGTALPPSRRPVLA